MMTPISRIGPQQLARGGQAVDDGHVDVHEHDVGVLLKADALDFESVAGLANDGDAAFEIEEGLEALAEELVIVGQHDTNVVGAAAGRFTIVLNTVCHPLSSKRHRPDRAARGRQLKAVQLRFDGQSAQGKYVTL